MVPMEDLRLPQIVLPGERIGATARNEKSEPVPGRAVVARRSS
jgi:hypothetical protein